MKSALTLLVFAMAAIGQEPPLPPMSMVDAGPAEPVTYPRTVAWNSQADADAFALTVNANPSILTTFTSATVQLVEGTNLLQCIAVKGSNSSLPAITNYLILPLRITGGNVVKSASPLGPWTVTALPPTQTNPVGPPVYFKLQPWVTNTLMEKHL